MNTIRQHLFSIAQLPAIGLVALMALLGCGQRQQSSPPIASTKPTPQKPKPPTNARELLGSSTVTILEGVNRADTFRVRPGRAKPNEPAIAGYPVISKGEVKGEKFAAEISSLLLSDESYMMWGEFNLAKDCVFQPDVAYRLWKGKEAVEVVLCFGCNHWYVLTKNTLGEVIHETSGSFDGARAELVRLAKSAFPHSREIRALKEVDD